MNQDITLSYKNQFLVLNTLGGGIKEYYFQEGSQRRDIIYGYSLDEEKTGSMGDILFPFPGRVENAEYTFGGHQYKLSGLRIKDGHANHGFAKFATWQVEAEKSDLAILSWTLDKKEYKDRGYPFSLKIILTYSIDDRGLTCRARVENFGEEAAPFGLGFHPYFTVGTDQVNQINLTVNAGELVEAETNLKPTGRLIPVSESDYYFQNREIGDKVIDLCYTGLESDNGVSWSIISKSDGSNQITIWQDENFPYLQLYSADTLDKKHYRRALAIEPQTCTGFAFNLPDMGLKILEPGEAFEGKWGVEI